MRRWTIGIMVVLLLAACHRHREKAAPDTVAAGTVRDAEETSAVATDDTVVTRKPTQVYEMRRDTAEMTNLRILARKQRTIYSPSLMVGEWQRETLHELYYADGSGRSWDTFVDDETMVYRDRFDRSFMWDKATSPTQDRAMP